MTTTPRLARLLRPAVGCGIVPPDLLRRIAERAPAPAIPTSPTRRPPRRSARWTRTPGSGSCARSSPSVAEATCAVRSRVCRTSVTSAPPRSRSRRLRPSRPSSAPCTTRSRPRSCPGKLVRGEGKAATSDDSVNRAYDGLGATWQLYWSAFQRDSLDAKGLALVASVHYQEQYDNAFWDGQQMVFGDGDGELLQRLHRRRRRGGPRADPRHHRSSRRGCCTPTVRRAERVTFSTSWAR